MSVRVSWDVEERPLQALTGLRNGLHSLEQHLERAVSSARDQGCSWEEIGRALGISRQSAWERFARR